MVVQKFYNSAINEMPAEPNLVNALWYKLINAPDFSLVKFSVTHFVDFAIGLKQLLDHFNNSANPRFWQTIIERIYHAHQ